MDDKPFSLDEFLPFAAADLIPKLLQQVQERLFSIHGPLASVSGRPAKKIDPLMFIYLLLQGHQIKTIASYLNTTPATLYNHFGDVIAMCKLIRDDAILLKQNELAGRGDRGMLVHLGKTVLGQSETINVNNDGGQRQFRPERPVKPEVEAPPPSDDDAGDE